MKKHHLILSVCVVAAVCASIFFGCNSSNGDKTGETEGNFTYYLLSDDTYSVKAKDDQLSGEIVIPSTFNGKSVTKIEENGFEFCRNEISKIVMPDTIKTIGRYAFFYCAASELSISEGVTSIESGAFSNCSADFVIPVTVTKIGSYAFQARSSVKYAGTAVQWENIDVDETALKYNTQAPAVSIVYLGGNA